MRITITKLIAIFSDMTEASGNAAAQNSSILLSPSFLSEFTSQKVDECCKVCGAGLVRKQQ